jgi:hypothetical protein
MQTQAAYAARLQAQMRVARAEMNEISGLRTRRAQVRQQLTAAKSELKDDWNAIRSRVENNWADLRADVAERHERYSKWDEARERKFAAHLNEAESVLREYAARDPESAANVRIGLGEAEQELQRVGSKLGAGA